ncbi:MAG TPA: 7-carboxy-7-deazaguanine synthase QueE [Bacteroidales bacterium]|nr:7-carboxy-7-deazaguanine synthase QueE [Bacteroidales bacterium]HQP04049.1 7-carboxy-7-deazaguanine synthase QueE [Bacteroidales bacterium]
MLKSKSIDSIPVIEEFYSVQGEGFHTGKAAYFLRVGGCDLGCRWCDSKESWDIDVHSYIPVSEIIERILQTAARTVVVTGGEPMLYDFTGFTRIAAQHGIACYLETSGAYPVSGKWHWICLSPKKQEPPVPANFTMADELKIVIYEESDFNWAEHCASQVKHDCHLFLQPEWSRLRKNANTIAEYVKQNPQWRISLQSHKYLNIP